MVRFDAPSCHLGSLLAAPLVSCKVSCKASSVRRQRS